MHPRLPVTLCGTKASRRSGFCAVVVVAVVFSATSGVTNGATVLAPPNTERLLNGSWAHDQQWEGSDGGNSSGGGSGWNPWNVDTKERRQEEGDGDFVKRIISTTPSPPSAASGNEETTASSLKGGGLLKPYRSFASYAWESSKRNDHLPLPLVVPTGGNFSISIPLMIIIGVQKGGTTNLRRNLLTHPLVSGMPYEVHFFDRGFKGYPSVAEWPGDGQERPLRPKAAGFVLSEYAMACVEKGKPENVALDSEKVVAMTRGLIVDSSPRYILNPLTPYRMKMVLPYAKIVAVLRDPTDRYFSQLRMIMCKTKPDPGYTSLEEQITTHFHLPGEAEAYLRRGTEAYTPYGALCRGENATAVDLWNCFESMMLQDPLQRGLYADQLERWFRVYHRSQIQVVDSADLFSNFTMTVARVAEWAGLPEHKFEYSPHRFSGSCADRKDREPPGFFAAGGRYTIFDRVKFVAIPTPSTLLSFFDRLTSVVRRLPISSSSRSTVPTLRICQRKPQ